MAGNGIELPVEVWRGWSRVDAEDHALVLVAMGIRCRLRRETGALTLVVAAEDAPRARQQLDLYAWENGTTTVARRAEQVHAGGVEAAALFAVTLVFVHMWAQRGAFGHNWFSAGAAQAGMILEGEWWRTLTALGLHGDAAHLMGNITFGALFGVLLARALGAGLTWFAVLLAGAAGNALNAWLQSPQHTAVGASTAVFAALGMLAGLMLRRQRDRWRRGLRRWTPLAAGLMLLAWIGVGSERTDVGAHLAGFAAGGLVGVAFSVVEHRLPRGFRPQAAFGVGALCLFALAWVKAFGG